MTSSPTHLRMTADYRLIILHVYVHVYGDIALLHVKVYLHATDT